MNLVKLNESSREVVCFAETDMSEKQIQEVYTQAKSQTNSYLARVEIIREYAKKEGLYFNLVEITTIKV